MKEMYFSPAEKQWMEYLMDMGMERLLAHECVIRYKREQAYSYKQQGNFALWKHLLQELGEWEDSMEDEIPKNLEKVEPNILLPGDF